MKRKRYMLILTLMMTVMLFAGSFAFFIYRRVSQNEVLVIAGNIYLELTDRGAVNMGGMYPMSDAEGILNGAKYQFNIHGYNESENDLYYGIYLKYGEDLTGTRFPDDVIKIYLTQTVNDVTSVLYGPGTLKDFNNRLIYASMINKKTNPNNEVNNDYELTFWIDESVLISDTITSLEGRKIYTKDEFENSYATILTTVIGDFKEKSVNLNVKAEGALKTSGTVYDINSSYVDTLFTSENVKVTLTSEKEVSKFVITNVITNEVVEKTPTLVSGKSVVELEYSASGSFVYYGVYSDDTTTTIDSYNVKIDKVSPSFVMENGGTYNVEDSDDYYQITNTISEITEDNDYTIMYSLVRSGETPVNYNKLHADDGNQIVLNAKSGIWDLYVKIVAENGQEVVEKVTYTITYNASIVNVYEGQTMTAIKQLIVGETYGYLESFPVIGLEEFAGYATDSEGYGMINDNTLVTEGVETIYVIYKYYELVEKPTYIDYCSDVTYNGEVQTLTNIAGEGYYFMNNIATNAGSYTINAVLKNGYRWSDNSTENVTFICNVNPADVTFTSATASKYYDGTPLTRPSASLTSGMLFGNHIATVVVTGSQTSIGSSDNTIDSVTILSGNNDVTSNYNIVTINGVLTIIDGCDWVVTNTSSVTSCSATSAPSNPVSGDTYRTCSSGWSQYRYKLSGVTCAGQTGSKSTSSSYVYSSEASAKSACTSNRESLAQQLCGYDTAVSGYGGCSAEAGTVYYTRKDYEYQCDEGVSDNNCSWVVTATSSPSSCTAVPYSDNPQEGDEAVTCSDQIAGAWRYSYGTMYCQTGGVVSAYTSGYSYNTQSEAASACTSRRSQSIAETCPYGGEPSSTSSCSTYQLKYYHKTVETYTCSE